ncbi:SpoIIE family protein phosphatase [Thalassotalea sp. M1531]|uniref:SpoIIE family protein phosphatase n=1 Tax=Thalassotalea algicola TaxID=2716224 RepID=A0A7Y0Q745_9GAMM|nr:SpoIIE family protein phosphatase [Thalassotalea algicola]NMP32103.1 SpoIIE family protein phosphatase [Thalassotalea algicola]
MIASIPLLALTISPRLAEIKLLRQATSKLLKKLSTPSKEANNILLALSEITSNVVKHANPAATQLSFNISTNDDCLVFEISDDGGAFYHDIATLNPDNHLTFDESGMGVNIIYSLFPECQYRRVNDVNYVRFSIAREKTNKGQVSIAVVEDEPMMREIIKSYLPDYYNVQLFEDGQQFLSFVASGKKFRFDLVISDISMPQIDGITLKKQLSEHSDYAQTPFIFLTAQDDIDLEMQANRLGIDNYLIKPIQKEKLALSVERALIRHQQIYSLSDKEFSNVLKPKVDNNIENFDIAACNISPFAGGGDFIFQQKVGDKDLVILADVMGHDVQAKLFAHSFAGFFSGYVHCVQNFDLSKMMAALSNQIFDDPLLSQSLVTYIAVLISKNGIEIASAGHPQPMMMNNDGYEFIKVSGHLPGVKLDIEYPTQFLPITSGQRLLLYTDGFIEWARDQDTLKQFINLLVDKSKTFDEQAEEQSVADLSQQWLNCFQHSCGKINDDTTIVVIEKK